jgi:hypothetical protein
MLGYVTAKAASADDSALCSAGDESHCPSVAGPLIAAGSKAGPVEPAGPLPAGPLDPGVPVEVPHALPTRIRHTAIARTRRMALSSGD